MHRRRAGDRDDCGELELTAFTTETQSHRENEPETLCFSTRERFQGRQRQTETCFRFARSGVFWRLAARLTYNPGMLTEEDKQWISQRLEKVETTLLTEFHQWASPVELRQRSHAAALRALDAEVESISDRLKNLEGR